MQRVYIIGAMKAGTTSLHEHLATHPEVCTAAAKEPRFFLNEAPSNQEFLNYEQSFQRHHRERWALESSTGYTKAPMRKGVAERIRSRFPDAKLIYIVRDPVERIYSHYLHNVAKGRETKTFRSAVRDHPEYVDVSSYYMQLLEYLRCFTDGQIQLIIFEEFVQDKLATLHSVFDFLDIDPEFRPPNLESVFNDAAGKSMLPGQLQRLAYRTERLKESASRIRPLEMALRLGTKPLQGLKKSVPSKADIRDLTVDRDVRVQLRDDISLLQEYMGREIKCWQADA